MLDARGLAPATAMIDSIGGERLVSESNPSVLGWLRAACNCAAK
jgi:hypothetical protein